MPRLTTTRVLVVDDSAFARKVLREALASDDIEVVDIARDGLEALEKIATLKPDVVTLDLMMPNLDGIGVLKALPAEGAPRVVVVSVSDEESELGLEALALGAVEVVHKPTGLATQQLYEISEPLRAAVRAAGKARARPGIAAMRDASREAAPSHARSDTELVVIGTSTGGPQALTRLLSALPAGFPVPIAIALHIPAAYTQALARRLTGVSALGVFEVQGERAVRPGEVALAQGGIHLKVRRRDDGEVMVRTDVEPVGQLHAPSVDVLFQSAAEAFGDRVLGVVLTGMGDDGLAGARAVRQGGGRVVTEAESSCVVYGMPRCVEEARLSNVQVPLEELSQTLVRLV
jgi:two-component system chemotaxis response regulator CheB